jgi:hypothetical protein
MRGVACLRVGAAVLLGILLFASQAHGQENPLPAPPDFTFGMVGLAPGQTARLSVVNIGSATPSPIPCFLELAFLDDAGKELKQRFVQVDRGKAAFLDLPASDDGGRVQVRGIGFNPLLIPVSLSCRLLPTLEVFNNDSGASSLILTNPVRLGSSVVPPPPSAP